jgi:hypothetical protein
MAYKVDGWGEGIAWSKLGPQMVDDEDTEWTGYQVETGLVEMVMIGDDRVFAVDPDDVHEIPDDAFCRDCGQIGCTSNNYV